MQTEEKVVTDPSVFIELSSQQRVLTVLQIAGHSPEQIANLTRRHSYTGALVNNVATCRDPKLRAECTKHKAACEGELIANRPSGDNPRWTVLEELELIIAVAGNSVAPDRLKKAFAAINDLQADPV